ncbi:NnrS family protein [Paracoccus sp. NSM]|uniref:NnrS family protein n=1 Tax=Paracoccus sp. NSM TaxID=3457784 RepID=UPI00403526B2
MDHGQPLDAYQRRLAARSILPVITEPCHRTVGFGRNLPVVGLISAFVIANAVFHAEASRLGYAYDGLGVRLGLATILMLIALIGGRIIPAFTRNWLAARGATSLPVAFGRGDALVLALTALALAGFVTNPAAEGLPWLMAAVAVAQMWRLSRWRGWQVRREPLLWVLHLAYLALGLGFAAEAAAIWGFMEAGASRHVWVAGAIGLMTLAVMTRATLGHTGRALKADGVTVAIFLAMAGSAVARVAAGGAEQPMPLLLASASLWALAFAGFAVNFGRMLLQPRQNSATKAAA